MEVIQASHSRFHPYLCGFPRIAIRYFNYLTEDQGGHVRSDTFIFSCKADAIEVPNAMIGRYTLHREKSSTHPKLYLIHVDAIKLPTLGIPDVGGSDGDDQHHLFLFRRQQDWSSSWDSMIDDLHQNRKTRAYSIEEEYEPERAAAAAAAARQMQLPRASEKKKRRKR